MRDVAAEARADQERDAFQHVAAAAALFLAVTR
jgi:hypothetical protein